MPENDPKVRLLHMRDYARKTISLAAGKDKTDLEEDEIFCLAMSLSEKQQANIRKKSRMNIHKFHGQR